MRSLSIAATGMLAQQMNIDVIANNIANMNTTGFKRHRPEFQDLLYQSLRRVGSESSESGTIVPSGVQIGVGVKNGSVAAFKKFAGRNPLRTRRREWLIGGARDRLGWNVKDET